MNTASIIIGDLYAINTPNHGVVRFKVKSIRTVSVRTAQSKRPDTQNFIKGVIAEGDMPGTSEEERTREVSPEAVISSYQERAALKAKQAEEERIAKEKAQARTDLRERLRAKLYEVTGLVRPPKPTEGIYLSYHEPFEDDYGSGIKIGFDSMEILLEALDRIHPYPHTGTNG